ncbi:hypothetical protein L0F63_004348 [Massospora cicadina]|nr:hypothetical protein L0F63_004348 [Massospora cicadina]
MGLEIQGSTKLKIASKFQTTPTEFKVQRDWYEHFLAGLELMNRGNLEPVPQPRTQLAQPHLLKFWVGVRLPDVCVTRSFGVDDGGASRLAYAEVASSFEDGGPPFERTVGLDLGYALKVQVVLDTEMKLNLSLLRDAESPGSSAVPQQTTCVRSDLQRFEGIVPYLKASTLHPALRSKPSGLSVPKVGISKGAEGALSVSPRGELLCVGGCDGWLAVIDPVTGRVLRQLKGHLGDVACVKFFPSGQVILSGGADFGAKVFGVAGECPVTLAGGHTRPLTGLAMVGRGRYSLTSSLDGRVNIWKVAEAARLHTIQVNEPVVHMAVHHVPDWELVPKASEAEIVPRAEGQDTIVTVGVSKRLLIYSLVSGEEVGSIPTCLPLSCACRLDGSGPLASQLVMALGSEAGEVSVVAIGAKGCTLTTAHKADVRVTALLPSGSGVWAAYGRFQAAPPLPPLEPVKVIHLGIPWLCFASLRRIPDWRPALSGLSLLQLRGSLCTVTAPSFYGPEASMGLGEFRDGTISHFELRASLNATTLQTQPSLYLDEEVLVSDLDPIVAMAGSNPLHAAPCQRWALTREGTLVKF